MLLGPLMAQRMGPGSEWGTLLQTWATPRYAQKCKKTKTLDGTI